MITGFLTLVWAPAWTSALTNHLLQSTAVALLAWLLTIVLRDNAARIRYAIWMMASVKFLVPFSLLTAIGEHWARPAIGGVRAQGVFSVIEEFSLPLRQTQVGVPVISPHSIGPNPIAIACASIACVWLCGFLVLMVRWISAWRRVSGVAVCAKRVFEGREFDALLRAEQNSKIRRSVPLLFSRREIEPGIFGVIRPVLLWPVGLSERLDDTQIHAIMAHEVEHVCRRDNLTSAIHAFVEAVFWFHPLVRWMTCRLSEERERACDERVIERNARPGAYADSILKVCAFCLEPPAACVSGVSGADLKERVLRIMTKRLGVNLSFGRKLALTGVASLVLLWPVGFGMVRGQEASTPPASAANSFELAPNLPKFEVSTVKPTSEKEDMRTMMMTPDGVSLKGVPLQMVLRQTFGMEDDRVVGAPGWTKSDRWDIEAKVAPEDAPKLEKIKAEQRRQMLLPVLVERFNLKYHVEQRELPTYALVIAKGGPKLTESKPEGTGPHEFPGPNGQPAPRGMVRMGAGRIDAHGGGLEFLAHALSPMLGRTVLDKTGLTGKYDFALQWTPDPGMNPMPGPGGDGGPAHGDSAADQGGPTIFTALEEQLGLKLEAQKSKVDVIVIDHIDLPSEN